MPGVVATLAAVLGLDDSDFQAGVERTRQGVGEVGKDLNELGGFVSGVSDLIKEQLTEALNIANQQITEATAKARELIQAQGSLAGSTASLASETAQLASAQKSAANSTDDFDDQLKKSQQEISKLTSNISTLTGAAATLGATLTASVTAPIAALAVGSVHAATSLDSMQRGLVAVTGSAGAAAKEMRELAEIGKAPGIGFDEALSSAVKLQAAGIQINTAEKAVVEFGNALATVGKGKAELELVGDELSRLASRTNVSAREIMELSRQVPQLRQIMQQAFGTTDTQALESMSVDSKKFLDVILEYMGKLPRATSGAQNAFDNLEIAAKRALAGIGTDLLGPLLPILEKATEALEFFRNVWSDLPGPVKVIISVFAGLAAILGPAILAIAGLGFVITQCLSAFNAFIAIRAAIAASAASNTTAAVTNTEAVVANTVAVAENSAAQALNATSKSIDTAAETANTVAVDANTVAQVANATATRAAGTAAATGSAGLRTFASGLGAVGMALGLVTIAYTIDAAIFEKYLYSVQRATQATEDETASHMASIPYLQKAIEARQELEELNRIADSGKSPGLKDSEGYKKVADSVEYLTKKYLDAKAAATEFNSATEQAMSELKDMLEKEQDSFQKATEKAQMELDKLRAPDMVAKIKVEFPDISDEEAKALALINQQVDAEKKLAEAKKKAADETKRQNEEFQKQIDDAKKNIESLRAGGNSNLSEARKSAPAGTSPARIQELAHLKDTEDALKKAAQAREEELKKVTDLAAKMTELDSGLSKVSAKTQILTQHANSMAAASPAPSGHISLQLNQGVPLLPPVGSGGDPIGALTAQTGAVKQLAAAHTELASASVRAAQALTQEIGAQNADKLITSLAALKLQLAELTATTDLNRTSLDLTGKTAANLSEKTLAYVQAAQKVKDAIKAQQELDTVTNSYKQISIELEKANGATDDQILSLELLNKDFDTLNPVLKGFITSIVDAREELKQHNDAAAQTKKVTDDTAKAVDEARLKFLATTTEIEAEQIALNILKERLKDVPTSIKTATDVLDYMSKSLKVNVQAVKDAAAGIATLNQTVKEGTDSKALTDSFVKAQEDARVKMLEASAASETEKVAIGLLKDQIKTVPADITNATEALRYLETSMGDAGKKAMDAAGAIAHMNEVANPSHFTMPKWMDDLIKQFEEQKKVVDKFNTEMAERMQVAQSELAGGKKQDPAQIAWIQFLEKNDALAKILAQDTNKAAEAQKAFTATFNAEQQATAYDKLAKMLNEVNEKVREQTAGLADGQKHVSDYQRVLNELGITANQVTKDMDGMINAVVKQRQQLALISQVRDELKKLSEDMKSVFQSAFSDLINKGFKGFVMSIETGFQQMLTKMASDFLASQLTKLVSSFFNSLLGAFGGGGGGLGGFDAGLGGGATDLPPIGAGMAAGGGNVLGGRSYIVGERGAEIFMPDSAGHIVPNSQIGGGNHYHFHYNISTPDVEGFRKSQRQITQDGMRHLNVARQRG